MGQKTLNMTADGDPVLGASNRKAENTSHEKGNVECRASSDRVAGHTPEHGANAQSHKERQRGESDLSVGNAKLGRQRAEAAQHKELPLVTAHADILDGAVDDL
ncbi:hypothetical protein V496_00141 [Pseudogymnoascus sp. VKM F-4515 (FW-2607)]|nr:hypothetical protein V496_00141 [Pseudogymnoascus sp. VKM F-4515 (FW-2607)]